MNTEKYTAQLQAGLGLIEETKALLDMWQPGMDGLELKCMALKSGKFATMSARRIRNMVVECFKPRYLRDNAQNAILMKQVQPLLNKREFEQLLFVYTAQTYSIMSDFITQVYWPAYMANQECLTKNDAIKFVSKANSEGLTAKQWSDTTVTKVASYLNGVCADFGLLEHSSGANRKILPCRIEDNSAIILIYQLHFNGLGDNSIVSHPMWKLFGMEREDVINELKYLSLRGAFIVQNAADLVSIGWQYKDIEGLANAIRS